MRDAIRWFKCKLKPPKKILSVKTNLNKKKRKEKERKKKNNNGKKKKHN